MNMRPPQRDLWQAVLNLAIDDALYRAPKVSKNSKPIREHVRIAKFARLYFLKPDRNLAILCNLAGVDPDWTRENVAKQVKELILIEEQELEQEQRAGLKYKEQHGGGSQFAELIGTGGGATAQEITEITISNRILTNA